MSAQVRLPVEDALPALKAALAAGRAAVLEAPPGAGKTTLAPLALKDEAWLGGRTILMLEPRRIAARAAAERMAALLGERTGETVGYHVRQEKRVGPATRIIVLTEALLTRRLQADPALSGAGLVIFDEFHERSLDADLGLALALEAQAALNTNLRLLVMSATLDGGRVAGLLSNAPIVRSTGRLFPIETIYAPASPGTALADAAAALVRRALRETEGGVLVFLPGAGEIRAVQRRLDSALPDAIDIVPLYGDLPFAAQAAALAPARAGRRKLALATSIAQTSVTIEDVRVVVDLGLSRRAAFDPATGMTRLETVPVSKASADQRRGRAGRVAPGWCYRLWSDAAHRALPAYDPPEIANADLAGFALELAAWGESDPARYALLDPPPAAAMAEAQSLLRDLRALGQDGRITAHGRLLSGFGAHPRLAHMMIEAAARGDGATAAALAALLSERDVLRPAQGARDTSLASRLGLLEQGGGDGALHRVRQLARDFRRRLKTEDAGLDHSAAGRIVALAYPERVAQRRGPRGAFRLRNGRGAVLDAADPLAGEDFLSIAALDLGAENARIHLAAPLTRAELEQDFAADIETKTMMAWDARTQAVKAVEVERLGALILAERRIANPDPSALAAAMLDGIAAMGMACLPWTPALRQLQARAAFLRRIDGEDSGMPDLSDEALMAERDDWLTPFIAGITRASQLPALDLEAALAHRLGAAAMRRLGKDAPASITVPSGSQITIDYDDAGPVLAVRLQEMFGARDTPIIAGGKAKLTLHLLSPARRPVQVTQDLAGFWARSYAEVKKELKGRYPKHVWPDDPLTALPTARAKPRGT